MSAEMPIPVARRLIAARMVGRAGDGAYYVTAALYFHYVLKAAPLEIGAVLSSAWVIALALTIPAGHLIDRVGPKWAAVWANIVAGVGVGIYLTSRSVVAFAIGAAIYAICSQTAQGAQAGLLGLVVSPAERSRVRAKLVSRVNAALGAGAGVGGVAIGLGGTVALRVVFAIDAASFVATAALLARLVVARPDTASDGASMFAVVRDRRFAAVSAINVALVLHLPLIDVALPLYIVTHTAGRHWAIAAIFIVNTTIVVFAQQRVASHIGNMAKAVRALPVAGIALAAACGLYGLAAASLAAWAATAVLLAAAVVMTFGEMIQTASTGEISYAMAPEARHGSYQNFFGSGLSVAEAIGPLALTVLLVDGGPAGWALLGAVFVLASIAMGPVATGGPPRNGAVASGKAGQ